MSRGIFLGAQYLGNPNLTCKNHNATVTTARYFTIIFAGSSSPAAGISYHLLPIVRLGPPPFLGNQARGSGLAPFFTGRYVILKLNRQEF